MTLEIGLFKPSWNPGNGFRGDSLGIQRGGLGDPGRSYWSIGTPGPAGTDSRRQSLPHRRVGGFPLEGEQEMMEESSTADLVGEVPVRREVFSAWLDTAKGSSEIYAHSSLYKLLLLAPTRDGRVGRERRGGGTLEEYRREEK